MGWHGKPGCPIGQASKNRHGHADDLLIGPFKSSQAWETSSGLVFHASKSRTTMVRLTLMALGMRGSEVKRNVVNNNGETNSVQGMHQVHHREQSGHALKLNRAGFLRPKGGPLFPGLLRRPTPQIAAGFAGWRHGLHAMT